MSNRFVCIHGHFYQPPRENAWLEVIEQQDSAHPFHDWNSRIAFECYGPNAFSRILNAQGLITNIVNNYRGISFNFGSTLLHWLETHAPLAYRAILDADIQSAAVNQGHGNAIAQVYNHIILPLANRRDKETQVAWGIRDFEHRFARKPEGMWLAETAVDTETLEVLAEYGIRFTVLAPRQARAVKALQQGVWEPVNEYTLNTTRPYAVHLPSGRSISVFFYDGESSRKVAFNHLLDDGKSFASELLSRFEMHEEPQLVHIATDGESYGHHHKHGDMALAFCLDELTRAEGVELINYAAFLERFPPTHEVQIEESSSWSCMHGIERWRSDCGCNTGGNPSWNQSWRGPLRRALDWLRDRLTPIFEEQLSPFVADVWRARNHYIEVMMDRSEVNVDRFIFSHCGAQLMGAQKTKFIRMLEMQRQSLLMYTSCGWFFDEVSGIETVQILQYAARAIQLAESETKVQLLSDFLTLLEQVPSNKPEIAHAAQLFRTEIDPVQLSLTKVGMHYAVASLFDEFPETLTICNYRAESEDYERMDAGSLRLAVGKTKVFSNITYSEKLFYFSVLYLGQNHIIGNASSLMNDDQYAAMKQKVIAAFEASNVSEVIGHMQDSFGEDKFSLWNLFKDEQRKVIRQIVDQDLEQAQDSYRKIYNRNYNMMQVLRSANLPVPSLFLQNLFLVVNQDLKHCFDHARLYPARIEKLAREVQTWNVPLEKEEIAFAAGKRIMLEIRDLPNKKGELKAVTNINRTLNVLNRLSIAPDWWQAQNELFKVWPFLLSSQGEVSVPVHLKEYERALNHLASAISLEIPQTNEDSFKTLNT